MQTQATKPALQMRKRVKNKYLKQVIYAISHKLGYNMDLQTNAKRGRCKCVSGDILK